MVARKPWVRRHPSACARLASLDEALGAAPPRAGAGAPDCEAIPLESIVGTAEPAKASVFDRRSGRPPVEPPPLGAPLDGGPPRRADCRRSRSSALGDEHFVDDGHHRVSVAHALGMAAIDAEVTELAA